VPVGGTPTHTEEPPTTPPANHAQIHILAHPVAGPAPAASQNKGHLFRMAAQSGSAKKIDNTTTQRHHKGVEVGGRGGSGWLPSSRLPQQLTRTTTTAKAAQEN